MRDKRVRKRVLAGFVRNRRHQKAHSLKKTRQDLIETFQCPNQTKMEKMTTTWLNINKPRLVSLPKLFQHSQTVTRLK